MSIICLDVMICFRVSAVSVFTGKLGGKVPVSALKFRLHGPLYIIMWLLNSS